MRSRSGLASTLPTFLLVLAGASSSFAQGNSGAYGTSIPIAVPAYRGLEPSLSLSYSSSGGNGSVGVGWALTGFSSIERTGTDGGSPHYDSTDAYRLGGQKLRECGSSSSPGCLAGGTHFTEHENYQRITYDSGTDTWTVDGRDGTTRTYTPVFVVSAQTFRWGLTSVEDTLGNTATYGWWCDGTKNCYPETVTFGPYRRRSVDRPVGRGRRLCPRRRVGRQLSRLRGWQRPRGAG